MILYFENSYGLGNNLIELSVLNTLYPDKTIYFFTNSPNLFPIFNLNIKVLRFKKSYFQRAPKFWVGHRKKEWYPFKFKWINYI